MTSTTTEMLLARFDEMAARLNAATFCREQNLPAAAVPLAEVKIALAVAGTRLALARWTARPPLTDDEVDDAIDELRLALARRVAEALAELTETRDAALMRTGSDLRGWNREREAVRAADRPSAAALAALKDERADTTMERVDLGNGRFRFAYRLRPSPER